MKSKATLPTKTKPAATPELRVSCRAPQEMVDGVAEAAKKLGVSDSDVVRMAIKRFLPEVLADKETQNQAA